MAISQLEQRSSTLTTISSLSPAKLIVALFDKLLPLLSTAIGTGLTMLGVTLIRSPLSPLPTPPLPYPPIGKNPIRNTVHIRRISDIVPIGYHYQRPVHHPAFTIDRNDVALSEATRSPPKNNENVVSIAEVPNLIGKCPLAACLHCVRSNSSDAWLFIVAWGLFTYAMLCWLQSGLCPCWNRSCYFIFMAVLLRLISSRWFLFFIWNWC